MKPKPFISHQWKDKGLVQKIVDGLIAKGMEPILDIWKFIPGDSLRKSMSAAIEASSSFVLFWSKNAAKSENVEFERELGLNEMRKKPGYRVICVLLDNTPPPTEHSYRLYIDWRRGKRKSKIFDTNLKSLYRAIIGDAPVKTPASSDEALITYNKAIELLEDYKKGLLLYDRIYYSVDEIRSAFPNGFTALADLQMLLGYRFEWRKQPGEDLKLLASTDDSNFVEICSLKVPDVWNGVGQWQLHDPVTKKDNDEVMEDKIIALYLASPDTDVKNLSIDKDQPSIFIAAIHLSEMNAERFYELAEEHFENIR